MSVPVSTAKVVNIHSGKTKIVTSPETVEGEGEGGVEDLIWPYLAGLIDADGTITFTSSPRKNAKGELAFSRTARVSLTMNDLDVLETIKSMTGLGRISLERRAGVRGANKHIYRWSVAARKDIRFLLKQLMEFLGNRKGAKALEMEATLDHWDTLNIEAEVVKAKKKKAKGS